jgi:FixJ family two-component response regulator
MIASRPTVHVVDDDASFVTAVTRLLRAGGYEAKTYLSAADFLQRRRPDTPGCVIVDVEMPGLTGLELQDALAKSNDVSPLIFLTGHGDIPTSVQAMRRGAEDFLTKPVKQAHLFQAVERALARDAEQRRLRLQQRELQNRFDILTPREREVLTHLLSGKLNKQIASDLGTAERTIKAHRANLLAKIGVDSMAELSRLAEHAGISAAGRG